MRRLAAVLIAGLAAASAIAVPASASDQLGVGNPGQNSFYALVSGSVFVTVFSGTGPAYGPGLQLDRSGLAPGVSVTPQGSGCVEAGSVTECSSLTQVIIETGGSGPGPAGKIIIRNQASTASITVDVLTPAQSTLAGSSITVTGNKGDVVAVPISVRNDGPNTLYWGSITGFSFEDGTELVSIDGCQPGPTRCTRDNLQAGASIDVTLHLRITGCDIPGGSGGYGLSGNPGPKFVMGRFKTKVNGCSGGSQGGQPAGSTAGGPASPSSTVDSASPEPSAVTSASPSAPAAKASTEPVLPAAAEQSNASAWPFWLAATVIAVLAAGAAGLRYRRGRRQTLSTLIQP